MTLAGILAGGQAAAESLMTDTCVVTRGAPSSGSLDPVTGLPVAGTPTTVYTGKCRLTAPRETVTAGSQRPSAGDVAVTATSTLSIPISAARLRIDDRVTITASVNPSLGATSFTVSKLLSGSHMTAQRVSVTAVIN